MNKLIVTITGPSASGKSTLERALTQPGLPFSRVKSVTTRPIRAGEKDGVEYDFVDMDTFQHLLEESKFIEHVQYGAHHYGALHDEFEKIFAQGKIAVVVVDPEGRRQYEKAVHWLGWDILRVYVSNPAQVRMQRLLDRFIADIEHLELGGEAFARKKRSFAERLALVAEEETSWDREALQSDAPYDLTAWEFNEHNDTLVRCRVSDWAIARAFSPTASVLQPRTKSA